MRIAFTHNLKLSDSEDHAEFDTPETIEFITNALRSLGHEVIPVDVSGSVTRLVARLETLRPDLIFNTAEGSHGRYREAFYPALFEQLCIPYTGSGAHTCAVTLDKEATKLAVQRAGVQTPQWAFFDTTHHPFKTEALRSLRFPVFIKPNFEGSSKGISADNILHDLPTLERAITSMLDRYPDGVLVEEFILGQDVTVPYIEGVGVLPAASYRFETHAEDPNSVIYDYTLKNELSDFVHVDAPAPLPQNVHSSLALMTRAVMRSLDIRDMGRADFRVTPSGDVYFIEVNALPSLEPGASIYTCATLRELPNERDVLQAILQSATTRQNISPKPAIPTDQLHIGLTFNLQRTKPTTTNNDDAEFDSPATIQAIADAIESLGHRVTLLEATRDLPRFLSELDLDLVFNIAEGLQGRTREAQIPALLDLLSIPYTGSDAAALAVTLDKGLAKRIVRSANLSTPAWWLIPPNTPIPEISTFPVIVKPNAEGSSKGITSSAVAQNAEQLRANIHALHAHKSTALVEEFLSGREFTVGLLGESDPTPLPILEVLFSNDKDPYPVYSYEHKISADPHVAFQVPAEIDPELTERILQLAIDSFRALGCRDVARVDIRLDAHGEPHFIECNPLPGLSPGFSDLCVAAEATGITHSQLIATILSPAIQRLRAERALASLETP